MPLCKFNSLLCNAIVFKFFNEIITPESQFIKKCKPIKISVQNYLKKNTNDNVLK